MISKRSIIYISICIPVILALTTMLIQAQAADTKNYEIRYQHSAPEYKTETTKAIDAYERLMEKYIDLNQQNMSELNYDVKQVQTTLNSINSELIQLSERLRRIEKALAIDQTEQQENTPDTSKVPN